MPNVEAAQSFRNYVKNLSSKAEFSVSDIDLSKKEDRRLLLQVALRGKTEGDYFEIVFGLREVHRYAQTDVEKQEIIDLTDDIMSLGEENLGIDWQ